MQLYLLRGGGARAPARGGGSGIWHQDTDALRSVALHTNDVSSFAVHCCVRHSHCAAGARPVFMARSALPPAVD
eukprot:COSAG02_NODE_137_length_34526_cov_94.448079_30_plen_73_part_01